MKDAYYFSHDSNARTDPNILKIRVKYGAKGYGIYFMILEMLRDANAYHLQCDYDSIAYELRESVNEIKDIIENYELFKIEKNYFYSESLLKRMEIKEAKSEKARQSAMKRWEKQDKDTNAMRTHNGGNAIKERKGKEIKEKESKVKEIIADLNEVLKTSYKVTSKKNIDLIKARINEGFVLEDFKKVHRNMSKRWGTDNKMREFLRPITLYSNKFESYLNIKQELPFSTKTAKNIKVAQNWLKKEEKKDVE